MCLHGHKHRSQKPTREYLLANGKQTFFYGVPLCFGEGSSLGKPVYRLQCGIDQRGVVFRSGKEGGTPRKQREHSGADVSVECQRSLCGAEGNLGDGVGMLLSPQEAARPAFVP